MERKEFGPAWWQIALVVAGVLAFVALGVWMVMVGDVLEKAGGLLAIVAFGGGGLYLLLKGRKGTPRFALVDGGLETNLPGMAPRMIPWSDIEGFGVVTIVNQEMTAVRLRSYASFLGSVTEEEAAAVVRFANTARLVGKAAVGVGAAINQRHEAAEDFLARSAHASSIADVLAGNRRAYGGEILLGWTMRDRSARAFAEYLEGLRRAAKSPSRPTSGS